MKRKMGIMLLFCGMAAFNAFDAGAKAWSAEDWASAYLGRPYVFDPLGEGEDGKYDQDPLFREDAFDCVTYVETVLALNRVGKRNKKRLDDQMNLIRYQDGQVGFLTRNHFMEKHWIRNARQSGLIKITSQRNTTKNAVLEVDLKTWFKARIVEELDASDKKAFNQMEPFKTTYAYLPTTRINALSLARQADEAVVFLMKCNQPEKNGIKGDGVAHMGLLFGGRSFYHASRDQGKVVKEDFLQYMENHPSFCGAMFYEIVKK